ncbi:Fic family protein [uncultured Pleomorphomonas sp.]|nr:Fic family protein [uncultured Pleomorphomonas sp.]
MIQVFYDAVPDPYCYAGTTVLRNRLGLRDHAALDAFEHELTAQRFDEPLPAGRLSVRHYQALHRHLFQDVYSWAGRFRTVRISKAGSMFCYPEHIASEMRKLFLDLKNQDLFRGLTPGEFADRAAHFLADLNAIHAFREGNGRTQLVFFTVLALQAGHPLDLDALDPEAFLAAMVKSFRGDEASLNSAVSRLVRLNRK